MVMLNKPKIDNVRGFGIIPGLVGLRKDYYKGAGLNYETLDDGIIVKKPKESEMHPTVQLYVQR